MIKRIGAILCAIVFILSFFGGLSAFANGNCTVVETEVEQAVNAIGSALMIILLAVVAICLIAIILYGIGGLFL